MAIQTRTSLWCSARQVVMPHYLRFGQNNRHRLGLPNSEIRVQIPGVNAGIGKFRKFTVPQGIKVLEAHSKLKGLDAAQIADIVSK